MFNKEEVLIYWIKVRVFTCSRIFSTDRDFLRAKIAINESVTCSRYFLYQNIIRMAYLTFCPILLFLCAFQRPTIDTEPDFLMSDLLPGNVSGMTRDTR